jgi:hypothetical protein
LAATAGFAKPAIHRSTRHIHRPRRFWQFKDPLLPAEFDVQVVESYGGDLFLGLYRHERWPFSSARQRAIVRESVSYIAAITAAYWDGGSTKRGVVGPWNRPDEAVEKAAIKYVKAKLRAAGYKVQSRENKICGYDLHATRDGEELHVEVKGASGDRPRFHISRTELKTADEDLDWRLAVVLEARIRPRVYSSYIRGKSVRRLFEVEPTGWFATERND